mgnify:CR=1 FL=1
MMRNIKFIVLGIVFGIILVKSEAIAWFRIQEMFRFQSFHMYGIIGSAVFIGAISILIIKKFKIKTFSGDSIEFSEKPFNKISNVTGGVLFGLGWALVGSCPGPLYALFGAGHTIIIIPIISAITGVLVYGLLKDKLPH